ncbi:GNAT family N-acetyltransferase [Arthrobacter alkaliphilus]|uniref:GNAT family N-acetyltransferase n=1 Tax=Arthrobacter alkaliphilus TaxID=369936 RepID=UPI001F1D2843|nr:GNAT family N-acetyltransferase [Arthrobacter alkaliphilus]
MGNSSFAIREPRNTDVQELAKLHVSTWKETYAHLLPDDFFSPVHLEQREQLWAWIVQNRSDQRHVAIAALADDIIGFALAGPAQEPGAAREIELNMLYVSSLHHGAGAGQALLDTVLGKKSAFLWVAKDNSRAQAFYRRNGFTADGTEVVDEALRSFVDIRMVR